MELKIVKEKQNALFKRKEIEATTVAEVTPSREEIRKLLADKFSVQEEAIKINNILGKFGSMKFRISASVYASVEDREATEPKKKGQKPTEEQPTETASAEPPKEEAKEEKKEEEGKANDNDKTQESTDQQDSELKSNEKSE